ncbi:MAG TPA: DEAD/DEAH box helicase family protein [Casimicrobiaceae bacterium]|nr:DEAD/DEAH box helicase family protein [Casimicrobiaceae bacterium]
MALTLGFSLPSQSRLRKTRRLGALLITATMDRCPDIGFDSYDRFFPSQDTMPAGGFGNLIALPLQNKPRENGNSVFLDDDFHPCSDQWAFLSAVKRLSRDQVSSIVAEAAAAGQLLGIGLPSTDEDHEPWRALPSRRKKDLPLQGELPESVQVVLGNQVYIERSNIPPALVNRIARLAAFRNLEFYAAQARCLNDVSELLGDAGIKVELRDERVNGTSLETNFLGRLAPDQDEAAAALLKYETGVLAAATAFGKTVVAAKLIAARGRNALILVHRRQLLDQWIARLKVFLDIPPEKIGVIHGGKRKLTENIDVALMQSLVRKGVVSDVVAEYGHVIVDECHHLPAVSFEAITRESKARYLLGLSATVTRKDGHHPIIVMQSGPIRYRVSAKKQAAARPFDHKVVFRHTEFRLHRTSSEEKPAIQALYAELARDTERNDLIFDDIVSALEAGRSPVVITERKDHLDAMANRLSKFARNVVVLRGGMSAPQLRAASEALATIPAGEERVLVATGRYLGEGFDDARLDTLFLTMPVSWRGILAQYAGRLNRLYATKRESSSTTTSMRTNRCSRKWRSSGRPDIGASDIALCPAPNLRLMDRGARWKTKLLAPLPNDRSARVGLHHRLIPRLRLRPNSQEMSLPRTRPATSRPSSRSMTGRQGTRVNSRECSMSAYLPEASCRVSLKVP